MATINEALEIAMEGINQGSKTVSYYNQRSSDGGGYSYNADFPRSTRNNKSVILILLLDT